MRNRKTVREREREEKRIERERQRAGWGTKFLNYDRLLF